MFLIHINLWLSEKHGGYIKQYLYSREGYINVQRAKGSTVFGTYQQIDSEKKKKSIAKACRNFQTSVKVLRPARLCVWCSIDRLWEPAGKLQSLKQINSVEVSPVSSASVCFWILCLQKSSCVPFPRNLRFIHIIFSGCCGFLSLDQWPETRLSVQL